MSTLIPPRPRQIPGIRRRFAFVASQFNQQYVQGLVDHATQELRNLAPNATLDLHLVPGAFEIPIVARELARQKRADVILALAVILKGKTDHAENLSRSVIDALQRIAVEDGVPIINAVLSLANETQARERCLEEELNRGTEAARAAVQICTTLAELREKVHG
jgi:6,7-dimethyl-8-ribityllumazine synthase